jgi:hypothetical protein
MQLFLEAMVLAHPQGFPFSCFYADPLYEAICLPEPHLPLQDGGYIPTTLAALPVAWSFYIHAKWHFGGNNWVNGLW